MKINKNYYTYNYFKSIINAALENNWEFLSFNEYLDSKNKTKVCILRHDIDQDLNAALKMSKIEKSMGIKANYFFMIRSGDYNLLQLESKNILRTIQKNNHHIGLHFHFDKKLNIKQINNQLELEYKFFKDEFSLENTFVSLHQPLKKILNKKLRLSRNHSYDDKLFKRITYRSDSNLRLTNEACLLEYFKKENDNIQLLIHPQWWTSKNINIMHKWKNIIANHNENYKNYLIDNEGSFKKEFFEK